LKKKINFKHKITLMILIKRNIIDINQNSEKRCEDCDIRYDGDEVIW